jgi:hypothetical protein
LVKIKDDASTPEGRVIDYERRLKVHNERRLAEIVPFLWFNKLPYDIRHRVWEDTLPGPRTLCPATPRPVQVGDDWVFNDDSTVLFFPKIHHTPNLAALSVCQESRRIALKRYRLCFGTPNVYADLDIDILYFGPWESKSKHCWGRFGSGVK